MSILRKEKRKIYGRKIKGFWEEYRKNRIGVAGLIVLLLYVGVAIIYPLLTPYDLSEPMSLAKKFAMPQWMTIFPQYSDLPPTVTYPLQHMNIAENPSSVEVTKVGEEIILNYSSKESATVILSQEIDYQYRPPLKEFTFALHYASDVEPKSTLPIESTSYSFELLLKTEEENEIWKKNVCNATTASLRFVKSSISAKSLSWDVTSMSFTTVEWLYTRWSDGCQKPREAFETWLSPSVDPARVLFSKKGKYILLLKISFYPPIVPPGTEGKCTLNLKDGEFRLMGDVHGILGTDGEREDVWTHLISGVRISLIVGSLAAAISTSFGIFFGVVSGYLGGIVDESIMRMVDILLCLPVLPLLIILIGYFSPNVYYVVLLIAIFGWQGLSRIIRSRVLSIREMPFIESAKAAGASNLYIVRRHIVPNVIPVALASMILSVPAAILTEAALSFIGFGDPTVPTWGRMLNHARETHAFHALAWWYVIPPGLAITFLCLAFVFIGHALDEIVNPKLRRRR